MLIDPELYPWLSVAFIAWAVLDCFFGYQVFKLTITLWGAVIGAVFGQAAGTALGLGLVGNIGGLVVGALLGGGIAFLLYLAAVFMAGFFFGATLGMLLLANYNQNVAFLAGCVIGVIGGVLAVKLQRAVLILATALLGAFRTFLGILYFTDRTDWAYYLFQRPREIPALIDMHRWLMPAVLVLAAIGAIAQFGWGGDRSGKKKNKDAKD